MKKLYLIPNFIGNSNPDYLSTKVISQIHRLRCFIVEKEKTARAFLKQIGHPLEQREFIIQELDKHDNYQGFKNFFIQNISQHNIGLLSEAGLPAIADPGAGVVAFAHSRNIQVCPLSGSSSIFLALMASGMDGQQFRFNGYLPVQKKERLNTLKKLERESAGQTQIFIETPYRNTELFQFLLNNLNPETKLCLACSLESDDELIVSRAVKDFKIEEFDLHKKPCIFLLYT